MVRISHGLKFKHAQPFPRASTLFCYYFSLFLETSQTTSNFCLLGRRFCW